MDCQCICGKLINVPLGALRSGKSKSCGCMKNVTHGDTGTPLYNSWRHMRARCRERSEDPNQDECSHIDEWNDYLSFKSWALSNGYKDGLDLCRNGDTGDYTPDNCRWGTREENTIEAHAKTWWFVSPSGENIEIYNLRQFCSTNNLSTSSMQYVHRGDMKSHKGYTKQERNNAERTS